MGGLVQRLMSWSRIGALWGEGDHVQGSGVDVFLSYKAEDRARVRLLVLALEAEGFSVWWDVHIGGGANWRQDIEEQLDAARCVIVAWTKRSVGPEGEFVRDEAVRARRRGVYLPVRLDAVDPPLGFGEVQTLSLLGWKGDRTHAQFAAVAAAVRARVGNATSGAAAPAPRVSRRLLIASGGAAGVALVGSSWWVLRPAPAESKRLAVLSYDNLSGDPAQDYFSDGIAEELRAVLARLGFEVIGRASSNAVRTLDTKVAAAKLGVAHILTGSVRRSVTTLRINAQLLRATDGVERWSQTYDRTPGDAIAIQTDIAREVAEGLRGALGASLGAALTLGGTRDPVAQDLLLQARKQLAIEGDQELRRSVALADAALARDPNYADALVIKGRALTRIAGTYTSNPVEFGQSLDAAERVLDRALVIAPELGAARAALAFLNSDRLRLRSALADARKALELSPDDLDVLETAGFIIGFVDIAEALKLADRAITLDPLDVRGYTKRAQCFRKFGRLPEALKVAETIDAMTPKARPSQLAVSFILIDAGQLAEARKRLLAIGADDDLALAGLGVIAAKSGDVAGAERAIATLQARAGSRTSYQHAQIYAQIGRTDQAFAELDNAVRATDGGLQSVKFDPWLAPLRSDARYVVLQRRLDFP